jgi:1-acyl-sn-glycerol-3-phosphate acyltransferase
LALFVDKEVASRIDRLEIPFNECGVDPYGITKKHLGLSFSALGLFYRRYFAVKVHGIEHVPKRGRAMLVGNHSGGVALDGAMVVASMFFDMEPPRLAQGMSEKFINRMPFFSQWSIRAGHLTGLPEHAERLLSEDRLLMVFPEGARGTAKLYNERYSLVRFGTGFIRLALKTRSPVVPFAFIGGGAAIPTIANSYTLGKLFGAPYVPITPYLVTVPLPVSLAIHYGEPMIFEGNGTEDDEVIAGYVEQVRGRIADLIEVGRRLREKDQSGARRLGQGAGA